MQTNMQLLLIDSLQKEMLKNEHVTPTVNDLQNTFESILDFSTTKMGQIKYECLRRAFILALKKYSEERSYEELINNCVYNLLQC